MSETNWVDRASRRIDAWPVGPLAALLLGAATGFFCWAMPYSPTIGRLMLVAAPALLAFTFTLATFRWIDARVVRAVADEGDDQEDWLTRPARPRRAAEAAPAARPFIIDAIGGDGAGDAAARMAQRGWPLPLVDRAPPASGELLLDAPLPRAEAAPPGEPAALPIEDLMARLASRIEGREAVAPVRSAPPTETAPATPPLSDAEALRAALADLHRMARHS